MNCELCNVELSQPNKSLYCEYCLTKILFKKIKLERDESLAESLNSGLWMLLALIILSAASFFWLPL